MRARLQFARTFVRGFRAHDGFEAAASIAFWFFLSLVPLLVLLGFLVGRVARSHGVDALLGPLLDVIPGTAEDIVRRELERLAGSTSSLAPLGVAGFLWTASSGLHNLMDVFETTSSARGRPWWKQRAIALVWVLVGLVAAVVLAVVLVNVDTALHAPDSAAPPAATYTNPGPGSLGSTAGPSPTHPDRAHSQAPVARARSALRHRVDKALHTPAEQAVAAVLMLVVGLLLLAGFYRFAVEHPAGAPRRVWPGTFTAVGCWLVVSWGFGAYVVSMASYAFYYGSLAAVAVMLVWLYLTSLSLIAGAEVNAQLERASAARPKGADSNA
jgi:membrane protein